MKIAIEGLVDNPAPLAQDELAAMPSRVPDATAVARGAVGEAVALRDVIARVRPSEKATHVTVVSRDGAYRASIPLGELTAGGWIAFRLDGSPLPEDKGGPFRLTVADGTTLCWNVKNVGVLRFTGGPEADDVPENPPH